MSAVSAGSRNTRTPSSRLPLTPKVTSSRRGGHAPNRSGPSPVESAPVATTPAMHITPNVVTVARGDVAPSFTTSFSAASQSRALNMRNLRS
ncbi:MAG: hypothetical protein AVDCRST_MAG69-1072 [uncultured Solirubrobacteraceae bacterium]|uniref:Uncharacterized protein n=1 Tax=uncultured Solirubrobacteraceae bacterium TaxID=1162706 RepID=A0A6J4S5W2_9ACTN|nr:MAG: hypothetical protein AVDCRST_MAG69-1072 [uncultured Solirubrobacteraceae bacterium]